MSSGRPIFRSIIKHVSIYTEQTEKSRENNLWMCNKQDPELPSTHTLFRIRRVLGKSYEKCYNYYKRYKKLGIFFTPTPQEK